VPKSGFPQENGHAFCVRDYIFFKFEWVVQRLSTRDKVIQGLGFWKYLDSWKFPAFQWASGPASPNLSVHLQAVPRLAFEVMKACCLLHLEFISYFVLVLRALSALTVKQAFCGLSLELGPFLLRQDDLKTLDESLQIIPIFFQRMCFSFSDLCFGKDFELMGSDKICTALRTYGCIVCPSVSPLSLPLTESSNLEKNTHIWS
jgi:hypothetical protein